MFVFDEASTRRSLTPWGMEVKRRLIDLGMKQQDLVSALIDKGYKVDKTTVAHMLRGNHVSRRDEEIKEINKLLGIL